MISAKLLKDAKHSKHDFMNFLKLLNTQSSRDALNKEYEKAEDKTLPIGLTEILPFIPFLPANRLDTYNELTLSLSTHEVDAGGDHPSSSSASTPPSPKRRRTQLNDTRDLQPKRIRYQHL